MSIKLIILVLTITTAEQIDAMHIPFKRLTKKAATARALSSNATHPLLAGYPISYAKRVPYTIAYRSLRLTTRASIHAALAKNRTFADAAENPVIIASNKKLRNALSKREQLKQFPFDNPAQPVIIIDHSDMINPEDMAGNITIWNATRALGKQLGLAICGFSATDNAIFQTLPLNKTERKKIKAYNTWAQAQRKPEWFEQFEEKIKDRASVMPDPRLVEALKRRIQLSTHPQFKIVDLEGTIELKVGTPEQPDAAHEKAITQLLNGLLIIRTCSKNI